MIVLYYQVEISIDFLCKQNHFHFLGRIDNEGNEIQLHGAI